MFRHRLARLQPLRRGFSLVEQAGLVAMIGVASATALPRFAELQVDAEAVALATLAGAAGTAMRLNEGGCQVTGQVPTRGKCVAIARCEEVVGLLAGALPPGVRVEAGAIASGVNGVEAACRITRAASGDEASFQGVSAGH